LDFRSRLCGPREAACVPNWEHCAATEHRRPVPYSHAKILRLAAPNSEICRTILMMRKSVRTWALVGLIVGLILVVSMALGARRIQAIIQDRVLASAGDRLASHVELRSVHVSFFPGFHVYGEGLVVRHHGRTDIPPLIQVDKFSASGGLLEWLWKPGHIHSVIVTGLQIHVPPRGSDSLEPPANIKAKLPLVIDDLEADDSKLAVLPRDPAKQPLEFDIHRLNMTSVDLSAAVPFHAVLTNPKPRGEIDSRGRFGPWVPEDPGQTPVEGTYSFEHVDLATFKGISGTLSSEGSYEGVLSRIGAKGKAKVPNFSLKLTGHEEPLETNFQVLVDGTNGNVSLSPVDAVLGESRFVTSGSIDGTPGVKGRTIELSANAESARLEDLLWLATKAPRNSVTGFTGLTVKISITPEEDADLLDRVAMTGGFGVRSMKFASPEVSEKIQSLSRRGQGKPADLSAGSDVSNLAGKFGMKNALLDFSSLDFNVPGAAVSLQGTYQMKTETLDFHGHLKLDAKLSQTQTGVKSFFLKPFDPLFAKKGVGTVLPIEITGTQSNPTFGLDLGGKKK
jgi:hypothetical protein